MKHFHLDAIILSRLFLLFHSACFQSWNKWHSHALFAEINLFLWIFLQWLLLSSMIQKILKKVFRFSIHDRKYWFSLIFSYCIHKCADSNITTFLFALYSNILTRNRLLSFLPRAFSSYISLSYYYLLLNLPMRMILKSLPVNEHCTLGKW